MSSEQTAHGEAGGAETVTVLVYSDDVLVRDKIKTALGRRPAADLPRLTYVETATPEGTVMRLDKGGIDVCVFDGEAVPEGGMGLCRQLKDEIYNCPPILVVLGRAQDAWLANWSRADAVATHPIDPVALAGSVADLIRGVRAKRLAAR
jgi:DNA-binding NarL/FixJ family response regulator